MKTIAFNKKIVIMKCEHDDPDHALSVLCLHSSSCYLINKNINTSENVNHQMHCTQTKSEVACYSTNDALASSANDLC